MGYIIVASLQEQKYYVSYQYSLNNLRFKYSEWLETYPVIEILTIYEGKPEDVNHITLTVMGIYGWKNVRGGDWSDFELEYPPNEFIYYDPFIVVNKPIKERDSYGYVGVLYRYLFEK